MAIGLMIKKAISDLREHPHIQEFHKMPFCAGAV
jgi:hypothetical protein